MDFWDGKIGERRKNGRLLLENGFTDEGNSFGDQVISGIRGLKPLIRKIKHFFGMRDHEAF